MTVETPRNEHQLYPPFNTAVVANNGMLAQSWQKFILGLWQRVGGGQDATSITNPSGSMLAWAGSSAVPNGWLLCDGREVARADFPDLFTAIGERWGSGDGTTTFNLPDLVDKFPRGGTVGGANGGGQVTLDISNIPAHTHDVSDPGHTHTVTDPGHNHTAPKVDNFLTVGAAQGSATQDVTGTSTTGITIDPAMTGITIDQTGAGTPFDVLPPYVVVPWIIKT